MVVVTEKRAASEVEDERSKVEEGCDELEGATEEADRDDREHRDEDSQDGLQKGKVSTAKMCDRCGLVHTYSNFRKNHFSRRPPVVLMELMDHVRRDSHENDGKEELEQANHPGG